MQTPTVSTKYSAVERQLNSAIRMFFMEEDEPTIHLVLSACQNVVSDLLRKRGKEYALHSQFYGMLRLVRDLRCGFLTRSELSEHFSDEQLDYFLKLGHDLDISAETDLDELVFEVNWDGVPEFWRKKRKIYNFLKHADRDHDASIDLSEINNKNHLVESIINYELLGLPLSEEMNFYKDFFLAFSEVSFGLGRLTEGAAILRQFTEEEVYSLARKNLCYYRVEDFDVEFPDDILKNATRDYLASHGLPVES